MALSSTVLVCVVLAVQSGGYCFPTQLPPTEITANDPSNQPMIELSRFTFQNDDLQSAQSAHQQSNKSSAQCATVDDLALNRTGLFNVIQPSPILNALEKTMYGPQYECFDKHEPRLILGKPALTSAYPDTLQFRNWTLKNGCAVQTFNVANRVKLTTSCTSKQCFISIPCVVPVVTLRYEYENGHITWKFIAEPITVPVPMNGTFQHDMCYVMDMAYDPVQPSKWYIFNEIPKDSKRQKITFDFLQSGKALELLSFFYKAEVQRFNEWVIMRAFSESPPVYAWYNQSPLRKPICDRAYIEATEPEWLVEQDDTLDLVLLNNVLPLPTSSSEGEEPKNTTTLPMSIKNNSDHLNININVNINIPPYNVNFNKPPYVYIDAPNLPAADEEIVFPQLNSTN